jgi:hypothetical protein
MGLRSAEGIAAWIIFWCRLADYALQSLGCGSRDVVEFSSEAADEVLFCFFLVFGSFRILGSN